MFAARAKSQPVSQQFDVDFSITSGIPLFKTKFGVYQTPLVTETRLLDSLELLREIGIHDLRYELGWGKPDVLAYDQISGESNHPTINYSFINAFTKKLKSLDVKPLFALTYCPNPLKSTSGWPSWKDLPNDLNTWSKLLTRYISHIRIICNTEGTFYEVWNEPDMTDPTGKMFFNGGPLNYRSLFKASLPGVRTGDKYACIGGPAIAYNLDYLIDILDLGVDFASIHAYDNYDPQLNGMRKLLKNLSTTPMYLTEYASFQNLPPDGPQSRYQAAMRFFKDVDGMLQFTDLTKVYWAQWLDAGSEPGMGLITWDGHRKALFNAFKIYSLMPVGRNLAVPDELTDIHIMAASDTRTAGVVVWNEGTSDQNVTVTIKDLPFSTGEMEVYRIDSSHSSYLDSPTSEELQMCERSRFHYTSTSWTGAVPGESVVFLRFVNTQIHLVDQVNKFGTYIRSMYWYTKRKSLTYSDYDPVTSIARLGLGEDSDEIALTGAIVKDPPHTFDLTMQLHGFHNPNQQSLFAFRIDFLSEADISLGAVLFHRNVYHSKTAIPQCWRQNIDLKSKEVRVIDIENVNTFSIDLDNFAPAGWNSKYILLSFILKNTGSYSYAVITLNKTDS